MSDVGENLLRNRERSETKSYIVGLERGRVWAEDYGDYFTVREFSELDVEELMHLELPHDEERYFRVLSTESPLEWKSYLKGWVAGVREVVGKY
jgi:hypothetical protein